ncbi:MAG: hypothetical protein FWC01_05010 [Treponema sp.]|nr:hypothetical protein [Treponema sp.]MCL2237238.1 hypothetical protein [Treponema sp.]
MAKKNNAIYAPGELSRVREKLGVSDDSEAKRMMALLGGQVGTERDVVEEKSKRSPTVGGGAKRIRRVDMAADDSDSGSSGTTKAKAKRSGPYPGDDPAIPARLSYSERVKIDQFSGQAMFEIKSSMQVLTSIFSFFKEPVDYVNPRFVVLRMNEYYGKIERLVNGTRNLFPKTNKKRNHQLKRASPFVYKILDVLRNWDIESLARGIAELQSHPRSIKVTDFSEVLRFIYRPMFILDDLSIENIKSAFKLVYKVLYIESPMDAKEKYQEVIRNIIASIVEVRRHVHFGAYPILMKMISDRFLPYERFFIERRRRFMAFLNITETEQLNASDLSPQQIESIDVEALQKNLNEEDDDEESAEGAEEGQEAEAVEEDPNDPKVIERKAKEEAVRAESKSLDQGRTALGVLFPKAGWDKLEEFPDMYPYFANIYSLRHGYELIAPTDPLQQIAVLLQILDDLFIGMRYVNFGVVSGADGKPAKVGDELGETLNNWRRFIEDSFSRDYLPRLSEYCRMLENSEESRSSPYARKNLNELHWIKRLYFLPYYKFESIGPPPFQKNDIIPIYTEVRKLRKYLTLVAVGIEQGTRAGGPAAKAPCNGITNPWEKYNFQIPNPVSKRLDMMLPPEKRMNATLIFFSLSAVTVLDFLVNNENSWAYGGRPGPLFRSVKNEGITPIFGVDDLLDADKFFRESLKKTN